MVLKVANPSQLATSPQKEESYEKNTYPLLRQVMMQEPLTILTPTRSCETMQINNHDYKIQKVNPHCNYIITYFTTYDN